MREYIYLIAPATGWLVAQGIKYILQLHKDGLQWGDFIRSGGMPSSHASFMASLLCVVWTQEGLTSAAFGIVLAVTGIICYDATGVRRTTGEQTRAIHEIAKANATKMTVVIHDARGHTLLEVAAGLAVGFIVGVVLLQLL